MPAMARLLMEVLRELREQRGLSRSQLSRATVRLGYEGVPEATIEALEVKPGRLPDADTLEALAAALDVEPGVFYEYPVAAARRLARTTRAAARQRRERPGPPSASGRPGDARERRP